MSERKVQIYPNPILRQHSAFVPENDLISLPISTLVQDLIDTMYANIGAVGLAAPQIGELLQIIVFDPTANSTRSELCVMINPRITSLSKWKYGREGCLSVPDYRGTVKRARKLQVAWTDTQGQLKEGEFRDFAAVIVQHEVDHLSGILFFDRIRAIEGGVILEPR